MSVPAARMAATPRATERILVATLAVVAVTLAIHLATRADRGAAGGSAVALWIFTALFAMRVVGQVLVRRRAPAWLPPTEQWNLTPYAVLLPTQIAILAFMVWVDLDFSRGQGIWVVPRSRLGVGVLGFALVYALVMAVRYVVRMRRPEHRWFGGAIPIVFHQVLAAWLFVFGRYHVSH